jgi:hypothetical protein
MMEMPAASEAVPAPKKRGRKLGGKNKPGHHAGRRKGSFGKVRRELEQSVAEMRCAVWQNGRATIPVKQHHIDESLLANSSHCAIAEAIKEAIPDATRVAVDLQTVRYTRNGLRFVFLTPHVAQQSIIIPFDQGEREKCKPCVLKMKPAFVVKAGARFARHTPDNEELRGTGLKVAEEQPHISSQKVGDESTTSAREGAPHLCATSAAEAALAEGWKPETIGRQGALIDGKVEVEAVPNPRKPRQPRAKISATKPDGSIPVTLGGKLPPLSVLARREFGLRVLARREFGLRQVKR